MRKSLIILLAFCTSCASSIASDGVYEDKFEKVTLRVGSVTHDGACDVCNRAYESGDLIGEVSILLIPYTSICPDCLRSKANTVEYKIQKLKRYLDEKTH